MSDELLEELDWISEEVGYEVDVLHYYDFLDGKVTIEELKEMYERESDT